MISFDRPTNRRCVENAAWAKWLACFVLALGFTITASAAARAETRTLKLYFIHTKERAEITFKRNGRYDQSGLNRSASISASAAYFGGAPATWDLVIPDFTGVSGWLPTWGLQDGTGIDWTVTAEGGAILFLDPTIADGATSQSASRSSSTPLAVRTARDSQDRWSFMQQLVTSLAKRRPGRM